MQNKFLNVVKSDRVFFLVLLGIHIFYFLAAWLYEGICTGDTDEYLQTAENLKYHLECYNWIWTEKKNPVYYTLRPPLYGVFILLCKYIYNSDYFVLLVQNLMSIFIWYQTLGIARALHVSRWVKGAVIISLILIPTQMIMVNTIGADLQLQFFLVLCLLFLHLYLVNFKAKHIVFYNISLALAVLTKPVMMYFWIPNLFFSILLYYKKRNAAILFSALIMPAVVFSWCLRNEHKTGLFHFSSIKAQNILDLNAGAVLAEQYGEEKAFAIKIDIETKANRMQNYAERCRFMEDTSVAIIKNNLALYTYCHVRGMMSFMLSIGRADTKTFFNHNPDEVNISLLRQIEAKGPLKGLAFYISHINIFFTVYLFLAILWNVILLIALLVFVFDRKIPMLIKGFLLGVVFYSVFVCGPGGYVRFKMAVLPYLLLMLPYFFGLIKDLTGKLTGNKIS